MQEILAITAWDESKLVGVARSVTNFAYCCCLADLALDEAGQPASWPSNASSR